MYHRPFRGILMALIIVSLLAVVGVLVLGAVMGRARHPSDEWWQGYMTGRLELAEGERGMLPYTFSGGRHTTLAPLVCGVGLLVLGLPLLLLLVGGLFFRRWAWKTAGLSQGKSGAWHWGPPGPWHEPSEEEIARMKAWHKAHSRMHAWCRGWGETAEEQPQKPAEDEPR
jgi:hypothetical protein